MSTPTLLPGAQFLPGVMILQPGQRDVYKRNGIIERTSVFLSNGYPSNPPVPLYTPYPDASTGGFVADQVSIEQLAGGFYRTTVVWVSIINGGSSYVEYGVKSVQVPIEQSNNFTVIAGTPSSPLNGAIFDGNGRFIGFGPGPYQGVVSAFETQSTITIRGSATSLVVAPSPYFMESMTQTFRGGVVEFEIVYNKGISQNGVIYNPLQN